MSALDPKVYQRRALSLDPESPIAIKRSVHTIDVGATAAAMIDAFARTLEDPGRMYGLIQLLRTKDKIGLPYAVGERFQGRYVLAVVLREWLSKRSVGRFSTLVATLLRQQALERALRTIENLMLSDYSEITEIELRPPLGRPYRLRYEYLEGTPIAGSLVFECHDTGPGTCRFVQTSEYQEAGFAVLLIYGTAVLKMHQRVFYELVKQAAAAIRAPILASDIPAAYYRGGPLSPPADDA